MHWKPIGLPRLNTDGHLPLLSQDTPPIPIISRQGAAFECTSETERRHRDGMFDCGRPIRDRLQLNDCLRARHRCAHLHEHIN